MKLPSRKRQSRAHKATTTSSQPHVVPPNISENSLTVSFKDEGVDDRRQHRVPMKNYGHDVPTKHRAPTDRGRAVLVPGNSFANVATAGVIDSRRPIARPEALTEVPPIDERRKRDDNVISCTEGSVKDSDTYGAPKKQSDFYTPESTNICIGSHPCTDDLNNGSQDSSVNDDDLHITDENMSEFRSTDDRYDSNSAGERNSCRDENASDEDDDFESSSSAQCPDVGEDGDDEDAESEEETNTESEARSVLESQADKAVNWRQKLEFAIEKGPCNKPLGGAALVPNDFVSPTPNTKMKGRIRRRKRDASSRSGKSSTNSPGHISNMFNRIRRHSGFMFDPDDNDEVKRQSANAFKENIAEMQGRRQFLIGRFHR